MSEMEKKICLGCMQEINADDVMCPHCGFDPNNYRDVCVLEQSLQGNILLEK